MGCYFLFKLLSSLVLLNLVLLNRCAFPTVLLQDDPFWTVSTMSLREKNLTTKQRVCSLEELLKLASYHNSTVVFRLQRPPLGHPCHATWINDTLEVVQNSGLLQSHVRGKYLCCGFFTLGKISWKYVALDATRFKNNSL